MEPKSNKKLLILLCLPYPLLVVTGLLGSLSRSVFERGTVAMTIADIVTIVIGIAALITLVISPFVFVKMIKNDKYNRSLTAANTQPPVADVPTQEDTDKPSSDE